MNITYSFVLFPFMLKAYFYWILLFLTSDVSAIDILTNHAHLAATGDSQKSASTAEDRLIRELFATYNPATRPLINANNSVAVHFTLVIRRITALEESTEELILQGWVHEFWIDERLKWDPRQYENITKLTIPASYLWLPHTVLTNALDGSYQPYNSRDNAASVHLLSSGRIYHMPRVVLRSYCPLDLRLFPWDKQTCVLVFAAPAPVDKIILRPHMGGVASSQRLPFLFDGSEWKLTSARSSTMRLQITPVNETIHETRISILNVMLNIDRKGQYHVVTVLLPTIVLTCALITSHLLPPESHHKTMLNIYLMIGCLMVLWELRSFLNVSTSYAPGIGRILIMDMFLATLSIVLNSLFLHLCWRSPRSGGPPRILRLILINHLGPVFARHETVKLKAQSVKDVSVRYQELLEDDEEEDHSISVQSAGNRQDHNNLGDTPNLGATSSNTNEGVHFPGFLSGRSKEVDQLISAVRNSFRSPCEPVSPEDRDWRICALVLDRLIAVLYVLTVPVFIISVYASTS